jgi:PhoPQ-activated pathogenicity-related protein
LPEPAFVRADDVRDDLLVVLCQGMLKGSPLAKFSWETQKDGSIRVECRDKPKEVNLWQATNPKARDFRLESIGRSYKKSPLQAENDGLYAARVDKPTQGWAAFFVELVFD